MRIKTNSNTINISTFSITEMSYIMKSYIEESFSDLQIKYFLTDKRSLQESGVRYFTEDNEVGKKKLGEKIKDIFEKVWDGILGIFNKIKTFFRNLIASFKIKSANPKNKDIIKNTSEIEIREIVKDTISIYYDLEKYGKALATLVSETSSDNFGGMYTTFSTNIDSAKLEGDDIKITRNDILNSAFGEFKDQHRDVQNKFKGVEKAFNNLKSKSLTMEIDDDGMAVDFKSVKEVLKMVNDYSTEYSKAIIHNSKMLVKIVDILVKTHNGRVFNDDDFEHID